MYDHLGGLHPSFPSIYSKRAYLERKGSVLFPPRPLLHVVVSNVRALVLKEETKEDIALQDTKRNQTAEACFYVGASCFCVVPVASNDTIDWSVKRPLRFPFWLERQDY
jgi:hypothetical protein